MLNLAKVMLVMLVASQLQTLKGLYNMTSMTSIITRDCFFTAGYVHAPSQ